MKVADCCERCGKTVVKRGQSSSSDMVMVRGGSFLYMCDLQRGELSRPSMSLGVIGDQGAAKEYCPDCLLAAVTEWVKAIKARGPSKIARNCIIFPEVEEA